MIKKIYQAAIFQQKMMKKMHLTFYFITMPTNTQNNVKIKTETRNQNLRNQNNNRQNILMIIAMCRYQNNHHCEKIHRKMYLQHYLPKSVENKHLPLIQSSLNYYQQYKNLKQDQQKILLLLKLLHTRSYIHPCKIDENKFIRAIHQHLLHHLMKQKINLGSKINKQKQKRFKS